MDVEMRCLLMLNLSVTCVFRRSFLLKFLFQSDIPKFVVPAADLVPYLFENKLQQTLTNLSSTNLDIATCNRPDRVLECVLKVYPLTRSRYLCYIVVELGKDHFFVAHFQVNVGTS